MAADAQGNDIGAVPIPVTGFAAVNFSNATVPALADLKADSLPSGYTYLGLYTQDGGYAEETETGDSIEFFQQGYALKAGDESIKGTITFAEDSSLLRQMLGFDAGASGVRKNTLMTGFFGLIIATTFKNGKTLIRGGVASVDEGSRSQEQRGEVSTMDITFKWKWETTTGFYRFKVV